MRLKDRVAIITGAGTGIGEAIAHKFAREGACLGLNGLPTDPVREVAEAIVAGGGQAVVYLGDVAEETAARAEAEELAQHCDLLLVIGTSGEVAPVSCIPHIAREWRALIVENNLEPTHLTSSLTDHFLKGSAGKALPLVLDEL